MTTTIQVQASKNINQHKKEYRVDLIQRLTKFIDEWAEGAVYKDDIAEYVYQYPMEILILLFELGIPDHESAVGLYRPDKLRLLQFARAENKVSIADYEVISMWAKKTQNYRVLYFLPYVLEKIIYH
jgi:hypothetical protein